jgi:hypothetical protein
MPMEGCRSKWWKEPGTRMRDVLHAVYPLSPWSQSLCKRVAWRHPLMECPKNTYRRVSPRAFFVPASKVKEVHVAFPKNGLS